MNEYMRMAVDQARLGIERGDGGPFGCVIVKDGEVIGMGHNQVLKDGDATNHGEMVAIRNASERLKTYDLSGCEMYTTGEPCHMCLCAAMWANISKIYYGATLSDNASIGFRDEKFENIFSGREKLHDYLINIDREFCLEVFKEYKEMDKTIY